MAFEHFGRVPDTGDTFQLDSVVLTVEQVEGLRIALVRAVVAEESGDDKAGADASSRPQPGPVGACIRSSPVLGRFRCLSAAGALGVPVDDRGRARLAVPVSVTHRAGA